MGKRFENTMILSDIDGTFLDDKSEVVPANVEAVRYYTENGGNFAFATGRHLFAMDRPIPMWRELMSMPGIFANGAFVYDQRTDKMVHSRPLDSKVILPALVDLYEKFPDIITRFTVDSGVKYMTADFDITPYLDVPCYKVVLESNSDRLAEAREYFYGKYGDMYSYSKSCDFFLEFLRHDATKGTMLDWLRDYVSEKIGGGKVTAYAVGDYENDIDMLRHADVPACPDNGYPMILDYCRENGLILCDNNKGTIAALVRYIDENTK
nr:HAD-IIB family hydrolase [Clostridia bacterium]